MKNYKTDELYNFLLKHYIMGNYPSCTNVVTHNVTIEPTGKHIVSLEMYFGEKIVFLNAHVFIDNKSDSIQMFNCDKLEQLRKI